MRYGCCINMGAADGIGAERLPILKRLGYDYAELPIAQVSALDRAGFAELRAVLRDTDLPCESCNNFFPASVRLTGEDADAHRADEYAKRAADLMAELGAQTVVFGSSGAKNVPKGFPHERAYIQIVEALRRVSDILKPYGIAAAIEPLNKSESNIINTAAEGLELAREVDCGNILLLVDWYHMFMENESPTVIAEAGEKLRHVHFAVTAERRFPRQGDDCSALMDALRGVGYNGRFSMEAYPVDFEHDAAEALEYIRGL